ANLSRNVVTGEIGRQLGVLLERPPGADGTPQNDTWRSHSRRDHVGILALLRIIAMGGAGLLLTIDRHGERREEFRHPSLVDGLAQDQCHDTLVRASDVLASNAPMRYRLSAGSQCSAIFPCSILNMSNHVVVYFLPLSFGSSYSRAKTNVTKSPSATI